MRKAFRNLKLSRNEHRTERETSEKKKQERKEYEERNNNNNTPHCIFPFVRLARSFRIATRYGHIVRVVNEPKACAGYIKPIKGIHFALLNLQVYKFEFVYPFIYRTLAKEYERKKEKEK